MSSQHGLAAVAEARRLHGAAVSSVPRSLLTTRVARASPSTSSAMIRNGLPGARDLLEQREHVLHHADLLLVDQDERVLEHGLHPLGVGHEVRARGSRGRTACPRPPRGRSRTTWTSSTVMTPSLPTFSIASAIRLPIVLSLLAAMRRDLGDLLLVLGRLGHLLQLLDDLLDRLLDAALEPHRVGAGGHVLQALAEDRLGQHGGGGGAVTGDVGGLGRDLLDHLGAHVLVGVLELDLLGDGHAVLRDGRAAELLVDDDVAALRAERGLDGLRHDVDAAQERRARLALEQELLGHR